MSIFETETKEGILKTVLQGSSTELRGRLKTAFTADAEDSPKPESQSPIDHESLAISPGPTRATGRLLDKLQIGRAELARQETNEAERERHAKANDALKIKLLAKYPQGNIIPKPAKNEEQMTVSNEATIADTKSLDVPMNIAEASIEQSKVELPTEVKIEPVAVPEAKPTLLPEKKSPEPKVVARDENSTSTMDNRKGTIGSLWNFVGKIAQPDKTDGWNGFQTEAEKRGNIKDEKLNKAA